MGMSEGIGIVGAAGDLGSQLTVQLANFETRVFVQDLKPCEGFTADRGVAPDVSPVNAVTTPLRIGSVRELIDTCAVIHWCAPLDTLGLVTELPEASLLVLHDSVMDSSVSAATQLRENTSVMGDIGVVHCYMNRFNRVVVEDGQSGSVQAYLHMKEIGLSPTAMTAIEHDINMAVSQGLFATCVEGSNGQLDGYAARGLLTPSGEHFKEARDDRDSKWTAETKAAIFRNPQLKALLRSLLAMVEGQD